MRFSQLFISVKSAQQLFIKEIRNLHALFDLMIHQGFEQQTDVLYYYGLNSLIMYWRLGNWSYLFSVSYISGFF